MSSDDDGDSSHHGEEEDHGPDIWSPPSMKAMLWAGLLIVFLPIVGVFLDRYFYG